MFITVLIWLFFCYLVGKMAEKRGRDFWPFALLSAVISPIGGCIVVLIAGNKKTVNSYHHQSSYGNVNSFQNQEISQTKNYSSENVRKIQSSEKHSLNR